jgi:hypothetical protein
LICSVSNRAIRAGAFFTTALATDPRPELPLGAKVVGHWPMLDEFSDQHTAENWARFIEVPLIEYPFAVGPGNDRAAVLRIQARLHPDDRTLTAKDWAMIARHLAWTAGITDADGEGPHRWVAIQSAPQRVDLIANLISDEDGAWAPLPRQLHHALKSAAHDIEDWMDLESTRSGQVGPRQPDVVLTAEAERGITVTVLAHREQVMADVESAGFTVQGDQRYVLPAGTPTDESRRRAVSLVGVLRSDGVSVLVGPGVYRDGEGPGPEALAGVAAVAPLITWAHRPASLASLLTEVSDDRFGDLPRLRRFTETAAALAGTLTGPASRDAQHRLEWIARRLYGIGEDFQAIAQTLTEPPAAPLQAASTALRTRPAAPRRRVPTGWAADDRLAPARPVPPHDASPRSALRRGPRPGR